MIFHKVTQEEITKANELGDKEKVEKLFSKFVKQHRTPKHKKLYKWFIDNLPVLDFILAFAGVIIAIVALFK